MQTWTGSLDLFRNEFNFIIRFSKLHSGCTWCIHPLESWSVAFTCLVEALTENLKLDDTFLLCQSGSRNR